jgi:hypothetical protein
MVVIQYLALLHLLVAVRVAMMQPLIMLVLVVLAVALVGQVALQVQDQEIPQLLPHLKEIMVVDKGGLVLLLILLAAVVALVLLVNLLPLVHKVAMVVLELQAL